MVFSGLTGAGGDLLCVDEVAAILSATGRQSGISGLKKKNKVQKNKRSPAKRMRFEAYRIVSKEGEARGFAPSWLSLAAGCRHRENNDSRRVLRGLRDIVLAEGRDERWYGVLHLSTQQRNRSVTSSKHRQFAMLHSRRKEAANMTSRQAKPDFP